MKRPLFFGLMALVLVVAACNGEFVEPVVTDVVVTPNETTVAVGATQRLSANVIGPGNPPQRVEWSSNNNAVAIVSSTGLVEGIAPGNAVITAISTFDPTMSGTATVRVTAAPPPPADPWTNAAQVTAVADPGTPIRSNESVTRAAPDFYQVRLPATLSQPLVYVELTNVIGGDAVVEVFSAAAPRESVYASRSAAWFGLSEDVLTLSEEELESMQIVVDTACRGPCIILERERPGQEVSLYVRVSAASAGTVRYNLHVYDDPYGDPGEPAVSQCQGFVGIQAASVPLSMPLPVFEAASSSVATAPPTEVAPSSIIVEPVPDERYRGALETFGDRDCYQVSQPVSRVALARATENLDIAIRADIYRANTSQRLGTLLVERGQQEDVTLLLGTEAVDIVVYSANNRAGPPATSNYELFFPTN